MKEYYYDHLLNIKTKDAQQGFYNSLHYHRYEPTPYHALEELFAEYPLKSSDRIVDFGCGKGRLNFYLHYLFQATVIGIEMNEVFYKEAEENKKSYERKHSKADKIEFRCCLAEDYQIHLTDNYFYFFNPFSIQIFMSVINHILLSAETLTREIELILYYASDEYIYFLENHRFFEFKKEVRVTGLYDHDQYERFLIYRLAI